MENVAAVIIKWKLMPSLSKQSENNRSHSTKPGLLYCPYGGGNKQLCGFLFVIDQVAFIVHKEFETCRCVWFFFSSNQMTWCLVNFTEHWAPNHWHMVCTKKKIQGDIQVCPYWFTLAAVRACQVREFGLNDKGLDPHTLLLVHLPPFHVSVTL